MGTKNLTAVMVGGEYKVAQYGQWDGYPSGQGVTILGFLSTAGAVDKLRETLKRVRFMDAEGKDKEFIAEYNRNCPNGSNDPDNRTEAQKRWFSQYISRDLGGEILASLAASEDPEIILRNSINFAGDSLSCEYAYVVDLDKGTFEVYRGFNKEPLAEGERFFGFPTEDTTKFCDTCYYQVKHVVTFPLSGLPTEEEFLAACKEDDEREDV